MSPGFSVGTSTALVGVARHRSGRQGCRALRADRGAGRRGGFACAIGRVAAWQRDDTHEALAYGQYRSWPRSRRWRSGGLDQTCQSLFDSEGTITLWSQRKDIRRHLDGMIAQYSDGAPSSAPLQCGNWFVGAPKRIPWHLWEASIVSLPHGLPVS